MAWKAGQGEDSAHTRQGQTEEHIRLNVATRPALLENPERTLCIVVDVLRATSSVVTMFERGVAEIVLADSEADAQRLAAASGSLLCGERGGLPPEGFDFGNSPSEFSGLDLSGKQAVFITSNGTRALDRAAASPIVLLGSFLNLSAVSERALAEATAAGLDITLVCAGEEGGRSPSLEDTLCAGAIVQTLLGREPAWEPQASAIDARRLYHSYGGSPRAALRQAPHAHSLIEIGLAEDVDFCAQQDRFSVVPRLQREPEGPLRLRLDR